MPCLIPLDENAAITAAEFQCVFPVFNDPDQPEQFSEDRINYWINLGSSSLIQGKWGSFWKHGVALFVAHNLALEHKITTGLVFGAGPGGLMVGESKSVGDVSKSGTYSSGYYDRAGIYAQTEWGRMLWQYILMFGAGGMQVNGSWQLGQNRSLNWPIA